MILRDRRQPHGAAVGQADRVIAQRLRVGDGADGADHLLAAVEFGLAAGALDLDARELLRDVAGGHAEGLQRVGIEVDADLAVDAADALDLRHAGHAVHRLA